MGGGGRSKRPVLASAVYCSPPSNSKCITYNMVVCSLKCKLMCCHGVKFSPYNKKRPNISVTKSHCFQSDFKCVLRNLPINQLNMKTFRHVQAHSALGNSTQTLNEKEWNDLFGMEWDVQIICDWLTSGPRRNLISYIRMSPLGMTGSGQRSTTHPSALSSIS